MRRSLWNYKPVIPNAIKQVDEPPSERRANLSNVANALLKADGYADKVRSLLGMPPVFG